MTPSEAYLKLCQLSRELGFIGGAASMLSWDQETYMPEKALPHRADQLAYLAGLRHERWTAPIVGEWISCCEEGSLLSDSVEAANIREWRRDYDRATRIPQKLVEDVQRATSLARSVWVDAKARKDFSLFADALSGIIDLTIQMAHHWGYQKHPYDALIEGYESGATVEDLRPIFSRLIPEVSRRLHVICEQQRSRATRRFEGSFPIERQQAFNQKVVESLGFDLKAGRIDTTAHPFCSGMAPGDCRLTTRYDEADFTESLYSVLHECGHGLYEQGLRADAFGLPTGEACSLGIHESQSRLWENKIGRSREFWEVWLPVAASYFPQLVHWTPEELWHTVTVVKPSYIRTEADEVSYDLHIALRFELEAAMIQGDLSAKELPRLWNEKSAEMFALQVPHDGVGCLQDIHWSAGLIGYFPTYTLGNLNAAMLFERAKADLPSLETDLKKGDYASLLIWLRSSIHQHGRMFSPTALMERVTGQKLSIKPHLDFIDQRYAP